MNNHFIPYPNRIARFLLRLPLELHRLGLGWVVSFAPILVLTTRGRKSGLPRHTLLEYRRHGNKLYILSAWGTRPDWYHNLSEFPCATVKLGNQIFSVEATPVTDKSEAQRVLYMLRRNLPILYDSVFKTMSTADRINLHTLAEVADEFTIVRLDMVDAPLPLPTLPADHVWVIPTVLGLGVVASASLELFTRLRSRNHELE
ncbi:MAG TPA: nitroreductase family deazaflavin-dependent oxidoreductase [Phototrophicaceae bacterium]|jgi:deazaflavin-dependent oxidoreductase (nitroreductase family)|nr:nitroreductase family deazaflavin-dependent oxidoreductase [Phototrophicaceae bacterium]